MAGTISRDNKHSRDYKTEATYWWSFINNTDQNSLVTLAKVQTIQSSKMFSPKRYLDCLKLVGGCENLSLSLHYNSSKRACIGSILVSRWPLDSGLSIDTSLDQLGPSISSIQLTMANESLHWKKGLVLSFSFLV